MFSSKVLSILVVVALICFAALVTLQVIELVHYGADPSVWPAS